MCLPCICAVRLNPAVAGRARRACPLWGQATICWNGILSSRLKTRRCPGVPKQPD